MGHFLASALQTAPTPAGSSLGEDGKVPVSAGSPPPAGAVHTHTMHMHTQCSHTHAPCYGFWHQAALGWTPVPAPSGGAVGQQAGAAASGTALSPGLGYPAGTQRYKAIKSKWPHPSKDTTNGPWAGPVPIQHPDTHRG